MPNRSRGSRRIQNNRPRRNNNRSVNNSLVAAINALTLSTRDRRLPRVPDPIPRPLPRNPIYTFVRSVSGDDILISAAGSFGSVVPTLNGFPNYTEFTTLFRKYRITNITIDYNPVASLPDELDGGAGLYATQIYTVIDHSDGTVPTNISQLQQYQTLMTAPVGKFFTRSFTPHTAQMLLNPSVTGQSVAPSKLWIDTAYPDVEYFALKFGSVPLPNVSTPAPVFRTTIQATLQFQDPY